MGTQCYEFQYGEYGNTTGITINLGGYDLLRYNNINRGTAFTTEQRKFLGLSGFLPPQEKTLEE
ncbi:MAG: NAD-dependent malic enzyme, partial [Desulfobacterales bacterium]